LPLSGGLKWLQDEKLLLWMLLALNFKSSKYLSYAIWEQKCNEYFIKYTNILYELKFKWRPFRNKNRHLFPNWWGSFASTHLTVLWIACIKTNISFEIITLVAKMRQFLFFQNIMSVMPKKTCGFALIWKQDSPKRQLQKLYWRRSLKL
jgi:hypothetical protein